MSGSGSAPDDDFESFVRANWSRLVNAAYLLTRDWAAAEDVVQIALTRCHRRWASIVAGGAELPYVRRAVVNAYISTTRMARFREWVTAKLPERAAPAGHVEAIDQRDVLWRALGRLPPRTRAAVVLRHYLDLSEEQTAEAMACSRGNVKRLTANGLHQLRAQFDVARPDHRSEGVRR